MTAVVMAVLAVGLAGGCAAAQNLSGTTLSFRLAREGAAASHYEIDVEQATGHGVYRSLDGAEAQAAAGKPITADADQVKKLFAATPLVQSGRCESHNKNIAQTGQKTLEFKRGAQEFTCTYNYGLDDRVNTATALFEALAETMQAGDRLALKLRFDRLGLDRELDELDSALREGRAVDASNILPVLQAIRDDDRVMERVRRKAAHLVETSGTGPLQAGEDASVSAR